MIMVHAENVNDVPLQLHIRTKRDGAFSTITAMALKVGDG